MVKLFITVFGNTLHSHINFMDRLKEHLSLEVVSSEDDSDVIIAFVAIASRAGTDIEAALQGIPQSSRPVVLVVLHHTFDPHFIAPDSRLCVNRSNVFTVDCLFHEDRGLLRSSFQNDKALKAVTDHLLSTEECVDLTSSSTVSQKSPAVSKPHQARSTNTTGTVSGVVKLFIMVFGNTLHSHINFMDHLKEHLSLEVVSSEDDSDVIMAFVAISSRAGTDIEAALQGIPQSSRPVVLVVLHHTFDPHFVAPDSRLCVSRTTVFTVDCLYHEDKGLLRCHQTDEALNAVTYHLISKGASVRLLHKLWTGYGLLNVWSTSSIRQKICTVAVTGMMVYFLYRLRHRWVKHPFKKCMNVFAYYMPRVRTPELTSKSTLCPVEPVCV
ncbi:uncharacterized protein [Salminus brasiliensis]|uniref:uncharacterized protein n=1 Tax=Salminus brasiliensis TaxID=930266 RepID=UPI003B839FCD